MWCVYARSLWQSQQGDPKPPNSKDTGTKTVGMRSQTNLIHIIDKKSKIIAKVHKIRHCLECLTTGVWFRLHEHCVKIHQEFVDKMSLTCYYTTDKIVTLFKLSWEALVKFKLGIQLTPKWKLSFTLYQVVPNHMSVSSVEHKITYFEECRMCSEPNRCW